MVMIPGEPQELQAVSYLGDEVLQEMGFAKESKTSGAQRISGKPKRASAAAQESNPRSRNQLYDGPIFSGYDCFSDKSPTLLKMPIGCREGADEKGFDQPVSGLDDSRVHRIYSPLNLRFHSFWVK